MAKVTLFLFSLLWLYYAVPIRMTTTVSSLRHGRVFESKLKGWADQNAPPKAVKEIFTEDNSLQLGGESKDRSFLEMIQNISQAAAIPAWPGVIGLVVVIISLAPRRSKSDPIHADRSQT